MRRPNGKTEGQSKSQTVHRPQATDSVEIDRRSFHRLAAVGLGAMAIPVLPATTTPPWPKDRKDSKSEKSPAELVAPARKSIDKGLDFLLRSQVKSGRNRGAFSNSGISSGVATASLGGLAMMCGGHMPGLGKFGKSIDMCVEYVLKNVRETGYIATRDGGARENMYR